MPSLIYDWKCIFECFQSNKITNIGHHVICWHHFLFKVLRMKIKLKIKKY